MSRDIKGTQEAWVSSREVIFASAMSSQNEIERKGERNRENIQVLIGLGYSVKHVSKWVLGSKQRQTRTHE